MLTFITDAKERRTSLNLLSTASDVSPIQQVVYKSDNHRYDYGPKPETKIVSDKPEAALCEMRARVGKGVNGGGLKIHFRRSFSLKNPSS